MEPYTVEGQQNSSTDSTSCATTNSAEMNKGDPPPPPNRDMDRYPPDSSPPQPAGDDRARSKLTRYTLRGVVVHQGQASTGHYYSFILKYQPATQTYKWYKYDDQQVSLR